MTHKQDQDTTKHRKQVTCKVSEPIFVGKIIYVHIYVHESIFWKEISMMIFWVVAGLQMILFSPF